MELNQTAEKRTVEVKAMPQDVFSIAEGILSNRVMPIIMDMHKEFSRRLDILETQAMPAWAVTAMNEFRELHVDTKKLQHEVDVFLDRLSEFQKTGVFPLKEKSPSWKFWRA